MTRYPAFIVRAAEAKLRDALDLANDRLRRVEDENTTLRRKLSEVTKSHDVAVEGWIRVAGERDELAQRYAARTDEGPLDFPFCPGCHELMFGEICSWCDGDSIATWEPEDAA